MKKLLALLSLLLICGALPALADPPKEVGGGIEFSLLDANAHKVYWAGDYNDWSTSETSMRKEADGRWFVVLPLSPGEYEYKFVIDGNWITDPDNPRTHGEYGNSFIVIKADGGIDFGGSAVSRAPIALNSKLFLGGLYYANYKMETVKREGERILLEKPRHDINFAFEVKLNPSLTGNVELNVDNVAELSEMWRTHLNMQRAKLELKRPGFDLLFFDNDAVFESDDLLNLAGDVGTYNYGYGYDARGVSLKKTLPMGFEIKALVADAGLAKPNRPEPSRPSDSLGYTVVYDFANDSGFRDDIVLQARSEFWNSQLLYLGKAARGLRPGNLYVQTGELIDSTQTRVNYRTVENQLLHTFSWRQGWTGWFETEVEYLLGEATLQVKDRAFEKLSGDADYTEVFRDERDWTLQKTHGVAVGASLFSGRSLQIQLRHHYQENSNRYDHMLEGAPAGMDIGELNAWARSYELQMQYRRGEFSYALELSQEEFEFDEGLAWRDHFWIAEGQNGAGNLWINGNHLPLAKYGLLGYRSASVIRNRIQIPFNRGRGGDMDLAVKSSIAATRLDRESVYWDVEAEWRWSPWTDWSFLVNERYAKYNQEFLGLDGRYMNGFVELSYEISPAASLSIGYGVDPYWFDPVSKEILPFGRREYLAEQGIDDEALMNNYKRMGFLLRRAEESMENIKRISLEARFDF